jgi:putative transposase
MVKNPGIPIPGFLILRMTDYHIPLFPRGLYHMFSRATGSEKLFLSPANYQFFLLGLRKYILPIAHVYAYCLLPNHIHLLVRIKDLPAIKKYFEEKKKGKTFTEEGVPDFLMERFSNLLNSYAKSYNKVYDRKGSLFIDYIRRVEIATENQLWSTVFYIHKNPVHHGYCKSIKDWQWSSFKDYENQKRSWVRKNEVLRCFGNHDWFLQFHAQPVDQRIPDLE